MISTQKKLSTNFLEIFSKFCSLWKDCEANLYNLFVVPQLQQFCIVFTRENLENMLSFTGSVHLQCRNLGEALHSLATPKHVAGEFLIE